MSGLWNWCVRNPPSPWPPVAYHVTNIMSDPSTTFSGMSAGRSCTRQGGKSALHSCMQGKLYTYECTLGPRDNFHTQRQDDQTAAGGLYTSCSIIVQVPQGCRQKQGTYRELFPGARASAAV